MSFLPTFMSGRRQPPARQASTAEVNASVQTQAFISTPSRRDSMSSLSSVRGIAAAAGAAAAAIPGKDVAPTTSSSSSIISVNSQSGTRSSNSKLRVETVFPTISSPESSIISLVSSPDEETVPRRRSMDHEWMDVTGDSTDDDSFSGMGTDRDSILSDLTQAPTNDNEVLPPVSDEHQAAIRQLQTELSTAHSEVSIRLVETKRKEEEIQNLRGKLEGLEKKLESISQENAQNQKLWDEEKDALRKQINDSRDRHEKIMVELERRTQAREALEQEKERLKDEKHTAVKQLEERIAVLDGEKDMLKERLVSLESDLKDAVKYNHADEQMILGLEKQLKQLQEENVNLKQHVSNLEREWKESERSQETRVESLVQETRRLEALLAQDLQDHHDTTTFTDKIEQLERANRDLQEQIDNNEENHCKHVAQLYESHSQALAEEQAKTAALEKELASSNESYLKTKKLYKCSASARRHLKHQLELLSEGSSPSIPSSLSSSSTFPAPELSNRANEEVYQVLQSLNYEIFQAAALLTDSLSSIYHPVSLNPNLTLTSSTTFGTESDATHKAITTYLGPYLTNLLQTETNSTDYNILPLQTSLQSTLIFGCTRIMSAWYPLNFEISDFLSMTYNLIHTSEGFQMAEAWKSTTKSRLKPTSNTTSSVVDFLFEVLSIVIRLAGWPTPTDLSGIEVLLNKHKEKLSSLACLALKLNVIFDTTIPQLEPALAEAGSLFDHHLMEIDGEEEIEVEDYNTSSGSSFTSGVDQVVCTTEIGIKKVNELRFQRGYSSRGSIVVKPKVILRSSFED